MLSVVEKFELLERAHTLNSERDFRSLSELLAPLPLTNLLADPELGHLLALAYSQTDQHEKMIRLISKLDDACANRGTDRLFRRRENLKAVALVRKGLLDEAVDLLCIVELTSELDGDWKFQATAAMNLGVIADVRCDWDAALTHYRSALVLFQQAADRASIGGCYHNLGMLFRQRGELFEAEAYFQRALENYQPNGTEEERIATDLERSLTMLGIGDLTVAAALAERGLTQAIAIGSHRLIGEAMRTVGKVLAEKGEYVRARAILRSALDSSQTAENPMLEAELHEEMSVIDFAMGFRRQSEAHLAMACRKYLRLGSTKRAERARLRVKEVELAAG